LGYELGSMQEASASALKRVLDHINASRFTGRLRVRAREAEGELWFMAGVLETSRFGVSKGDEALKRMEQASEAVFEAEPLLPSLTGDFGKRVPFTGSFQQFPPVTLMRFCERYAITCTLELRGKDRTLRLVYQTGELISDEADRGGNEALAGMLESQEGTYIFSLPPFDLPAGIPRPSAPPAGLSLAERVDLRLMDELGSGAPPPVSAGASSAALEAQKREQEAAEARRKAEQEAEARRKAEQEAEARRKAEQEAEARRKAEAEAAARRKAEAEAAARRKAEEEAAAARRRAEEEAAQAKRRAEQEAEAKRKADEEAAEAKRKAEQEAEAKRRADEEAAEAKRKAERAAEAERAARHAKETAERAASVARSERDSEPVVQNAKKSSSWLWVLLLLIIAAIAYVLVTKR
jgi:hypothetical protein